MTEPTVTPVEHAVDFSQFARRIVQMTGQALEEGEQEVALSIERLFAYAAWADKYEGTPVYPATKNPLAKNAKALQLVYPEA